MNWLPGVHNSGHYTIEACPCSQFENHIRAILDWPLGSTDLVRPTAAMVNLLGKSEGPAMPSGMLECLQDPETHLHIYGKTHSKRGEKWDISHFWERILRPSRCVRLGLLNQSSLVCRTGLTSCHFFPPLALSKQTMPTTIRSLPNCFFASL